MGYFPRTFGAALLLLPTIFLSGCPQPKQPKWSLDGTNTTDSTWVVRQQAPSRVAVVFVHGIFGDTIGTWTNPSGAKFFDLLNTVPGIAGKTDMLAFGFPSEMFRVGSFDIREAANRLQLRLSFHGVLDYQRIVFVAHSMGGLVVLRELLTHPEVRNRVPIEKKESIRWLENLKQSTALFHDPWRCVHIGDRESDIYELFCTAQAAETHFLVRTCVDRLAGDGKHTIAD